VRLLLQEGSTIDARPPRTYNGSTLLRAAAENNLYAPPS
jgi:hypothetical protein